MSTTTVLCVIGTRPEAIKMAPVVRELRRRPEQVRCVVCATAQHREMLDQVLKLFGIVPDHDLDLMRPDQALPRLTAEMLTRLDEVAADVRPDWMLAQGDTTTVLVAGLVAFYRRVRFGHVEAGLRTGNLARPFPEEANRRIADVVADLLFAPTEGARAALAHEGVPPERVLVTGNTVVDALEWVSGLEFDWRMSPLHVVPADARLVAITAHRRESFGEAFREMCHAIRELAETFAGDGVHFVYPVHLSPNVRRPVEEILRGVANVHLTAPLAYVAMVQLMKRAEVILTDSGGIQEEAPSLRVPVLLMRRETERPEGVAAGVVRLVGTERTEIVAEAARLLRDPAARSAMATARNPYGDGRAAERIVAAVLGEPVEPWTT
jgi:UDP-N-acetylglucosamine 2-epimerase